MTNYYQKFAGSWCFELHFVSLNQIKLLKKGDLFIFLLLRNFFDEMYVFKKGKNQKSTDSWYSIHTNINKIPYSHFWVYKWLDLPLWIFFSIINILHWYLLRVKLALANLWMYYFCQKYGIQRMSENINFNVEQVFDLLYVV